MKSIIFREAKDYDVNELSRLRIDFIKLNHNITDDSNDHELDKTIRQYIKTSLHNNDIYIYLAEDNGNIIGTSFASYYTLPPKFTNMSGKNAHITNVYVLENYRGRGIAKKMMKQLLSESQKRGCETVNLVATEMGKKMYQGFGFKDKEAVMSLDQFKENLI